MSARVARHPALWPMVALVALLMINAALTPNFASITFIDGRLSGSLIDIVKNGSPVMLLAVGMTLVIASGGIDLSVGSVMALSGAAAALLMTEHAAPVVVAAAVALAVAAAVGALSGALVAFARIQPIVATLVMLVAIRGLAQALTDDQKVRFAAPSFETLARGSFFALPVPFWIVITTALLVILTLRATAFGLYLEASGVNPRAARLCGLHLPAIRIAVYTFCALCAGLAGLIAAADIKEADVANSGLYLELDAILAVAIGGTALTGGRPYLLGSIIGALIMQTLRVSLLSNGVREEHALLIKAVAAIAVCAMQTPAFASLATRFRRARIVRGSGGAVP